MNPFSKAIKEKAKLSKFGRRLLGSRNINGTATPEEWLTALRTIQNYRKYRRLPVGLTTTLIIFSILGIIFTLIVADLTWTFISLVTLIFAINLLCYIRKGKYYSKSGEILGPIIAILREDMKPGAPLAISLDYTGALTSSKKKSNRKIPSSELPPGVRSRTETLYEDPWLTINGKLIDQTSFQILCQNEARQSKSKKRSRSGKIKSKTKYKYKADQSVTLKPLPSASPVVPSPLGATHGTTIKQGEDGSFSITATHQISAQGKPYTPNADADLLLSLFGCAMTRYKIT